MSALFASIGGFFTPSTWKWIGTGLAALTIIGTIGTAGFLVKNTRDELIDSQKNLAVQTLSAGLANARADQIQDQHDQQVIQANALEAQRTALSEEVAGLRTDIENMDLEADIESDKPDIAISRLNGRHSDLNRMLERASRNLGGNAGTNGVQASSPRAH